MKTVAVIQPVKKMLPPRFNGFKIDIFCKVPNSQYDNSSKLGNPIWKEKTSIENIISELEESFSDVICLVFDRYDTDEVMLAALKSVFDGTLDAESHNAFRGIRHN